MQSSESVLIALLVLSSAVIGASTSAQEQRHPGMNPGGTSQGAMMQGGGTMDMGRIQERMQSMQQLMERIHKSDDPAARRKLLKQHMRDMQQTMMDMRGMMGGGMMQGGPGGKMGSGMMGGGGMMNGGKGMTMEDRQMMIEQRLDLMQQMMEQMLEQQSQMTR